MGDISKNFSWNELAKGYKLNEIPKEYQNNLIVLVKTFTQPLRDRLETAVFITSGYRSYEHNKAVGGASNSQHCLGTACDIYVSNKTGLQLFDYVLKNFSDVIGGIGLYSNENLTAKFIHVDQRKKINGKITTWYQNEQGVYVELPSKYKNRDWFKNILL